MYKAEYYQAGHIYPYESISKIQGKNIVTKGTNVNIRKSYSTTSAILKTVPVSGTAVGKSQGRVWYDVDAKGADTGYMWYEIDGGSGYIRDDLATLTGDDWKPQATTTATTNNDEKEAQKLLDEIVALDIETMNNLTSITATIQALKAKGVNTTTSENKVAAIFARLQERQDAMKKSTWCKVKDTISTAASNAWSSVKKFFGFNGLGSVALTNAIKNRQIQKRRQFVYTPVHESMQSLKKRYSTVPVQDDELSGMGIVVTTTLIIITGISLVAGASAVTAIAIIKPWKNQSNIDLKESKELKALLEQADPVVAQKIREDIKSQLVDAYTTGNRQGSVSSIMSIGKYVLIAGAALFLAPKIMDYFSKSTKK